MLFSCAAAEAALLQLDAYLLSGGAINVNELTEGTTYMDMFDPHAFCLFEREALVRRYAASGIPAQSRSQSRLTV